jgi:16S rRNA (cytosine967-C5)-methyltransferase
MLDSVLRRGSTLDSAGSRIGGLAAPDHGLAIAIAGEVLRRLPDLDLLIDSAMQRPLPADSKARMVLRLALAQAIGLGTPPHAVVATALPLVEGGPRRLVHGVLGALFRKGLVAGAMPHLPAAVEERWALAWGDGVIDSARAAIAKRPPLDLSFKEDGAALQFARAQDGHQLARNHVRIPSQSVMDLPGFEDGDFWVQDVAASLPARLVTGRATTVLDLCAAPGGKTMQLAARGHSITALDRDGRRIERLQTNLQRTGLAATVIQADLLAWAPSSAFDAILLDSPCSATGTFRRHPEVLTRARPAIVAESAELQSAMLERAANWLAPGGALIYAVCSLEREEGEDIVAGFLDRRTGFAISPPIDGELPSFVAPTTEGWVRILPGVLAEDGGCDGFFIARLVAKG